MTWLTAFLDLPASTYDADVAFWRAVTGYGISSPRGTRDQFATLVPAEGDAQLRVQRIESGAAGVHLDVHVPGLDAASARALELGATLAEVVDDVRVMASPGGLDFCLVDERESQRPPAAAWGSHRSLLDQVCLDIPASAYDAECDFWAALLELPVGRSSVRAEFRHLVRPAGAPIRLLLQRLDESVGPVRAHLDLATDGRAEEVARHERLGASVVRSTDWWTTLLDPAGLAYCVTGRDPETGLTI